MVSFLTAAGIGTLAPRCAVSRRGAGRPILGLEQGLQRGSDGVERLGRVRGAGEGVRVAKGGYSGESVTLHTSRHGRRHDEPRSQGHDVFHRKQSNQVGQPGRRVSRNRVVLSCLCFQTSSRPVTRRPTVSAWLMTAQSSWAVARCAGGRKTALRMVMPQPFTKGHVVCLLS